MTFFKQAFIHKPVQKMQNRIKSVNNYVFYCLFSLLKFLLFSNSVEEPWFLSYSTRGQQR